MNGFNQLRVSLMFALILILSIPLHAAPPDKGGNKGGGGNGGGGPAPSTPVAVDLETLYRLSGDSGGPYDGTLFDYNLLLHLSGTSRTASVDLNSPSDGGPALGVTTNDSLSLNVRGQIELMEVGENRSVDALFTFTHHSGKPYRVNFSGGNGTSLVQVTRVSETQWVVTAPQFSLARVWDVTRQNKAVLIGLYSMDFQLTITRP